ncbi:MAG: hypothetical protein R2695_17860 [Acidimicrobiales bacterium]
MTSCGSPTRSRPRSRAARWTCSSPVGSARPALVSMALHDRGIESDSFTGSQAGFLTDTSHRNAKILDVNPYRVREALDAGRVPVVGGSQGVSVDNDVTFFGRAAPTRRRWRSPTLGAEACELYTDVPGVFTTDPRGGRCPQARPDLVRRASR